jgi:hypothetical protein
MGAGAALLCIVHACCLEQRVCCGDARGPSLHKIFLRACIASMLHVMMLTPDQDERGALLTNSPGSVYSDCGSRALGAVCFIVTDTLMKDDLDFMQCALDVQLFERGHTSLCGCVA